MEQYDPKIFDIEAAYVKISDGCEPDISFLKEVLVDYLNEINIALQRTSNFILSRDFVQIKNTFHQIKGSSAMLCCEYTRACCMQLQYLGEEGMQSGDEVRKTELLQMISNYFQQFMQLIEQLRGVLEINSLLT